MSSKPTAKDAELLIKLYEIGHSTKMKHMQTWALMLEEKTYSDMIEKYPMGSDGWINFISICGYYELCGTLLKNEAINPQLLLELQGTLWDILGPLVYGFREAMGNDRIYSNYEWYAKHREEWVMEQEEDKDA